MKNTRIPKLFYVGILLKTQRCAKRPMIFPNIEAGKLVVDWKGDYYHREVSVSNRQSLLRQAVTKEVSRWLVSPVGCGPDNATHPRRRRRLRRNRGRCPPSRRLPGDWGRVEGPGWFGSTG